MFFKLKSKLFRFLIVPSPSSSLSLYNYRFINISVIKQRNFFDYEQFEQSGKKYEPPKKPDNFQTAYKRRPLYWMIRNTDAFEEHNRLCIIAAGISFVIMCAMVTLLYYRNKKDPEYFSRKFFNKMIRKTDPDSLGMSDLKKRLMDLDLMSNFLSANLDDYGEIELLGPQIDLNYDDIRHGGVVLQRKEIGRDLTTLNKSEKKTSSLKEVDQNIRNSDNGESELEIKKQQ